MAIVAYVGILGALTVTAFGLYKGFRAAGLI
ncbi:MULTISPECIES: cytochrome b6-f complex subunit PetL [Spirulina sp. CCY15215]|nr:cytochrome b6-f complex subunit PetL [Spirulina major]